MIDLGDPARTLAYHVYREGLIHSGKERLIHKFKLDHLLHDYKATRQMSEWAKKKGRQVDDDWRCLVDLHRLNDYLPYPTEDKFYDDIKDWVTRRPLHTWNGDEDAWYVRFEKAVETVLFRSGKKPREEKTIDWFCNNSDVWCTAGSGFEPEVGKTAVFDKKRQSEVFVKKNKWAVRWNMSTGKVKHLLTKRRQQICKAVAKSEPGKVRAVISSDLSLYLKMSYVSLFLDQILRGRKDSTLWMNKIDRLHLWGDMKADGTWRMPLDQSEFDKNVTKRQVMIMLACIRRLLIKYECSADMLNIMDEIIFALEGGLVFVSGKSIPIENGILSGWRWTAMLDTIVNLAELEMAQDWVRENSGLTVELLAFNAQGDDDWIKVRHRYEAIALWLAYESFGLEVNPGKFFLDNLRDEYLRRVMDRDKITGYPARSITSICFRSPLSAREGVGAERIRSVFGRWKLFTERLDADFHKSWFWYRMIDDCYSGLRGSSKRNIESFLELGVNYGGVGVTDYFYDVMIPSVTKSDPHPMTVIGEGYDEWVKFVAPYGVSERSCNRFAVSTLDLMGQFKIPNWIKGIYSLMKIETSVPVQPFSGSYSPGYIFIGAPYSVLARKFKARYFESMGDLRGLFTWTDVTYEQSRQVELYPYDELDEVVPGVHTERLIPKTEISVTSANLSEQPDLAWINLDNFKLKGKPKSWQKDFITGKLSARVAPIAGWGMDVVGAVSDIFFPSIVSTYLMKTNPTIKLWDSLLAKLNVAVSLYVQALPVRIVE